MKLKAKLLILAAILLTISEAGVMGKASDEPTMDDNQIIENEKTMGLEDNKSDDKKAILSSPIVILDEPDESEEEVKEESKISVPEETAEKTFEVAPIENTQIVNNAINQPKSEDITEENKPYIPFIPVEPGSEIKPKIGHYERVWVVDKKAYTETVYDYEPGGYRCTGCAYTSTDYNAIYDHGFDMMRAGDDSHTFMNSPGKQVPRTVEHPEEGHFEEVWIED